MKRLLIPVLVLVLALGGCAGGSIFTGGTSLTATVNNPVGKRELYLVENAFAAAERLLIDYRSLGLCAPGQRATLGSPCAARPIIRILQAADQNAYAAIVAARKFIRNNPTVSAVSAIGAAQAAVADFAAALTSNGVQ